MHLDIGKRNLGGMIGNEEETDGIGRDEMRLDKMRRNEIRRDETRRVEAR